jgi:hypothetical protein
MQHQEVLDKIEEIKIFLKSIGFKQTNDFPDNWNLDSRIAFLPEKSRYLTTYNNDERIVLRIEIEIVGGILVVLSGKYGTSVFQSIKTDYDFKAKYEEGELFKSELRDFRLKKVLYSK